MEDTKDKMLDRVERFAERHYRHRCLTPQRRKEATDSLFDAFSELISADWVKNASAEQLKSLHEAIMREERARSFQVRGQSI
jgi:hypothetical protein